MGLRTLESILHDYGVDPDCLTECAELVRKAIDTTPEPDEPRKPQIHVPIHVQGVVIIEDMRVARVSLTHYLWEYSEFGGRIGETDKDVVEFVDEAGIRIDYDADIVVPIHQLIEADPRMDDFDTWQVDVWTEGEDRQMRP